MTGAVVVTDCAEHVSRAKKFCAFGYYRLYPFVMRKLLPPPKLPKSLLFRSLSLRSKP